MTGGCVGSGPTGEDTAVEATPHSGRGAGRGGGLIWSGQWGFRARVGRIRIPGDKILTCGGCDGSVSLL